MREKNQCRIFHYRVITLSYVKYTLNNFQFILHLQITGPLIEKADMMLQLNENFRMNKKTSITSCSEHLTLKSSPKSLKNTMNWTLKNFLKEVKKEKG